MLLRPLARILAFTLPIVALCSTGPPVNAQPADAPALQDTPARYDDAPLSAAEHVSAAAHRARRDMLLNALPGNAVALVFAALDRTRQNGGEDRQGGDLFYLTGAAEPGSVLLLAPGGVQVEGETAVEVLFVPQRDPAQADLGIQRVVSTDQFEAVLQPVLVDADRGDGTKEGARTLYLLPRADGVPQSSAVAEQRALIDAHRPPAQLSSREARTVFDTLVGLDSPEAYAEMRTLLGLTPETDPTEEGTQMLAAVADDAVMQDVLDAVRDRPTFDGWTAWRDAFLAGKPDTRFLRAYLDQARSTK
ncbi:MAG: aminopeptidase P N-terminal domain-containing protein [Bacteroidota bacterium]